jgi:hypothetical protein
MLRGPLASSNMPPSGSKAARACVMESGAALCRTSLPLTASRKVTLTIHPLTAGL